MWKKHIQLNGNASLINDVGVKNVQEQKNLPNTGVFNQFTRASRTWLADKAQSSILITSPSK